MKIKDLRGLNRDLGFIIKITYYLNHDIRRDLFKTPETSCCKTLNKTTTIRAANNIRSSHLTQFYLKAATPN